MVIVAAQFELKSLMLTHKLNCVQLKLVLTSRQDRKKTKRRKSRSASFVLLLNQIKKKHFY